MRFATHESIAYGTLEIPRIVSATNVHPFRGCASDEVFPLNEARVKRVLVLQLHWNGLKTRVTQSKIVLHDDSLQLWLVRTCKCTFLAWNTVIVFRPYVFLVASAYLEME